ncbi:MAG: hypothetical protein CVU59_07270 [Deltaproteobacteria bacterium HGW-Deltaproteobacteria-17]|nr:MAG: hypothetical protein CVU59_07270 [Deltaproteobacteria bacterium HGW-Deltaproteobacteria-17]
MEPPAAPFSFREEDFQLFQEERRANNRFNKDRLALKEKLARIGARLLDDSVPLSWTMEIGSEHPAVWNQRQVDRLEVFFMRPEEERRTLSRALNREIPMSVLMQAPSPLYAHASLGFFLDEQGIEVGFRLPFLAIGDRFQLRKLIADPGWGTILSSFSEALSGFSFGIFSHGKVETKDCALPGQWEQELDLLEKSGHGDHRAYLGLVKRITVSEAVAVEEIHTLLGPVLRTLGPFAKEHVWMHERDLLGLDGMIAAQVSVNQAERERSEQIRQELIQPRPVVARPIMTSQPAQQTPAREATPRPSNRNPPQTRPSQPAPRRDAPTSQASRRPENPRKDAPAQAPAAAAPRPAKPRPPRQEKRPITSVEPGAHVFLTSGPFAGKEAIVLSELPDGHVRVRVGIMQMTVEMKDCLTGRD